MTNPVVIEATPGTGYLDITREFDAPVQAVFRAHADPELFVQWIGPRGLTSTITSWDFRDGGNYGFEQRDAAGDTYGFRGVFHTVIDEQPDHSDLRIPRSSRRGEPGSAGLRAAPGWPLPAGRPGALFTSAQALERMVAEGMEHGVNEGYQKLDELLRRPVMPDRSDLDRILANRYCVLGTADQAGTPWVTPVFFAPLGPDRLCWVSSPDSRHSRNIAARSAIAITVYDSRSPGRPGRGGLLRRGRKPNRGRTAPRQRWRPSMRGCRRTSS